MLTKPHWYTTTDRLKWLILRKKKKEKDVEQQYSFIGDENINWFNQWGTLFCNSCGSKSHIQMNCAPRNKPNGMHAHLHQEIYTSTFLCMFCVWKFRLVVTVWWEEGGASSVLFVFIYLLFIFILKYLLVLEREEGRERETLMWERNISWLPPISTLLRDSTHNPAVCRTGNQTPNLLLYRMMCQQTEPDPQRWCPVSWWWWLHGCSLCDHFIELYILFY